MLSRGLRLDALKMIRQELTQEQQGLDSAGSAAALIWLDLHTGLTAALLGQWSVALKALEQVELAGAAAAVAPEVHLVRSSEHTPGAEDRGQLEFHLKVFEGEMTRLKAFLSSEQRSASPDLKQAFSKLFI